MVIWLYEGREELFPDRTKTWIESHDLLISPMVRLELFYLHEVKKLIPNVDNLLEDLYGRIGLTVDGVEFSHLIHRAGKESWTRDPFDRLIVSQAKLRRLALISKDEAIRNRYRNTVWG